MASNAAVLSLGLLYMLMVVFTEADTKAVWSGELYSDPQCAAEVSPSYCHELNRHEMRGDWIKKANPMTQALNSCEYGAGGYELYTCKDNMVYELIFHQNNSKCEGELDTTLTLRNGAGGCFAKTPTRSHHGIGSM